jgi:N-acyl-D-amino-acid deacylase
VKRRLFLLESIRIDEFDILISNGTLFSMVEGDVPRKASVGISDGIIQAILPSDVEFDAKEIFDASGMFITPGFVDSHVHDEYFEDTDTVQHSLIKQGVTTAIAGHCGLGPSIYKCLIERPNPWLNLGYMTGNCALREEAGHSDRYTEATEKEKEKMCLLLERSLKEGSMGLSLGLQYAPGASYDEISRLASVVAKYKDRLVTVHTRYAGKKAIDAVKEAIALSRDNRVRVQISHLASQTMRYTQQCIDLIEKARAEGVDVAFDCYPYDVFCAQAGSAVFDSDCFERWGKGPECLLAVSGRFAGERLTSDKFAIMREEEPSGLIAGYVLNQEEVEMCLLHPSCTVVSDGLYTGGTGVHPRLCGTFPRAFNFLKSQKMDWTKIIMKMTSMPSDIMRIPKGRISIGSKADIIVFDPDNYADNSSFEKPFERPSGMYLVVINGKVAFCDGSVAKHPVGEFLLK